MQATIKGEFLALNPTKSGKGSMLSLLQERASCELYVPNDVRVPSLDRLAAVTVEAVVRPGYEGKGFQASVVAIRNGKP
jgi:hypothetical protein